MSPSRSAYRSLYRSLDSRPLHLSRPLYLSIRPSPSSSSSADDSPASSRAINASRCAGRVKTDSRPERLSPWEARMPINRCEPRRRSNRVDERLTVKAESKLLLCTVTVKTGVR
eukprot:scaffold112155_cov63-Phaeocystis_antarctica.AAC.3